jgi:hypothetical protein
MVRCERKGGAGGEPCFERKKTHSAERGLGLGLLLLALLCALCSIHLLEQELEALLRKTPLISSLPTAYYFICRRHFDNKNL